MKLIKEKSVKKPDILHIVVYEKFIPDFISLISKNLDAQRHHFFFLRDGHRYTPQGREIVTRNDEESSVKNLYSLLVEINSAEKIVLHGLFSSYLILMLFLQPWLLCKCYWVIWGGDLYTYTSNLKNWKWWVKEFLRRPLIRNFGHLVTQVPGEVALARQWYGAKGQWHESFVYPSNLYSQMPEQVMPPNEINILVGNSADPSNNHIEVFEKLSKYAKNGIVVYCPLSYGDQEYADKVSAYGAENFGERFVPLREFMSLEKYKELLAKIDIAIFNHKRQQAMGNITTLLGMGKKVYLSKEITTWNFFEILGITVFDVDSIEMTKIDKDTSIANIKIVQNYFSEANLVFQLKDAFQ